MDWTENYLIKLVVVVTLGDPILTEKLKLLS